MSGVSKNTVKQLHKPEDLKALLGQASIVVINTYRGIWCPFCRKYLSELNKRLAELPEDSLVVGISVDDPATSAKLQHKLKLDFDLVPDENLVMRELFSVTTGKGHGKEAYLQPSVFIFKNGEKVFEWIQTPKMLNFGGAISRLSIDELIAQAQRQE